MKVFLEWGVDLSGKVVSASFDLFYTHAMRVGLDPV